MGANHEGGLVAGRWHERAARRKGNDFWRLCGAAGTREVTLEWVGGKSGEASVWHDDRRCSCGERRAKGGARDLEAFARKIRN